MDEFVDRIAKLATRSKDAQKSAITEEATKNAVIMPFLQALGFDVFNPDEVIPEYTSDVGIKKGEKVDYAIKIDGKISVLIEAKQIGVRLGDAQYSQLFRYFSVTEARLAILTNGREAWFFSDTEEPNKMDKKPFFTFDFQTHDAAKINDLSRFQKDEFHIDSIIEAASNLKFTRDAVAYLKDQLDNPSDDFVRFVGKQIYDGSMTKGIVEQIKPAIQSALEQLIRDRIQDKLGVTFQSATSKVSAEEAVEETSDDGIETTEEELEGYRIIRAIGARIMPIERITIRDAKSYCAVFIDDVNRKPVCRMYFNSPTTKSIGIFDENKVEVRHHISEPADIYKFCNSIEAVIRNYV